MFLIMKYTFKQALNPIIKHYIAIQKLMQKMLLI